VTQSSLVHPLSPSGKLVHWGLAGLDATRRLVDVACRAAAEQQQPHQQEHAHVWLLPVVLRREILRVAVTPQHVDQLLATEQAFTASNNNNNRNKNSSRSQSSSNSNDNDDDDNDDTFSCRWMNAQEIERRYNSMTTSATTTTTTTTQQDDDAATATNKDSSSTDQTNKRIRGGLLMAGGGCQVLHVPSYLQALWLACLDLGRQGGIAVEWKQQALVLEEENKSRNENDDSPAACSWHGLLAAYDTIVLAAGSGMFGDLIPLPDDDDDCALPVHLVRGQSIEMDIPSSLTTGSKTGTTDGRLSGFCSSDENQPALLCGKYVSPLPPTSSPNGGLHAARILIGATHEFQAEPMSPDQVVSFLRNATAPMLPSTLWQQQQHGENINDYGDGRLKITSGFRVQSQRGKHGRMPIIGRYQLYQQASSEHEDEKDDTEQGNEDDAVVGAGVAAAVERCQNNNEKNAAASGWCPRPDQNVWIFTGLSSRGLLYHALYGDLLTDAILTNNEQVLWAKSPDLKWWKKRSRKRK
jgi:glycine/D-amino acid oxidase-like deaminating enzyme